MTAAQSFATIVFGHDFDGPSQTAICDNCGQMLKNADVRCNKLKLWAQEEETLP